MFWLGLLCGFGAGTVLSVLFMYKSSNSTIALLKDSVDELLEHTEIDDYFKEKWSQVKDKF